MNFRNVIKVLLILLIIITGFMVFPLMVSIYYGEFRITRIYVSIILSVMTACSVLLYVERNNKIINLTSRDGFMFVSLSWALASLIGSLPFFISGAIPDFSEAYFETMSGFTTTGASILTDIESVPKSILFWRSMTHWLGGMGIVVLTVAILPVLGIGGLQLIKAEAPGPSMDKISSRITVTAKNLWLIYVGMTVLQTLLLMAGEMDFFDAVTHSFATLATGGFSTKNTSVAHFNSPYIHGVVTIFMIFAGVNFTLYYKILSGRIKSALHDSELLVYISIFLISSLLVSINLFHNGKYGILESFQYSTFQVASILTTTGFATADYELWPNVSQVILFLMMFIGGCSGSTGGGIKVIRIITLLKKGLNEMKYLLHPSGVFTLKVNGQMVKKDIAYTISGFFFLYIFMLLITTLVVASADIDILTSLSSALATVGNIGPGFGLIGPVDNYHFLPPYVKWFLSFAMMVGRLELYTVLVLFTKTFWSNR